MRKAWVAVSLGVLLVGTSLPAVADDSLNDLFNDSPGDTVLDPNTNRKSVVSILDRPVYIYYGEAETQAVAIAGYQDLSAPLTTKDLSSSLYYYFHLKGGADVEPIPQARVVGTFSTYLPQGLDSTIISNLKSGTSQTGTATSTTDIVSTSSVITVDELYLDYQTSGSSSFRIGKFGVTWGQGHVFNPGNFVSDSSDGVNLKAFATAGAFTFSGIAIGAPSFFEDASKPKASEIGYGESIGFSWGQFTGGVSTFYQLKSGFSNSAFLKTSLGGFDLYTEGLNYFATENDPRYGVLAGFYREVNWGVKSKVVGEFWYDGRLKYTTSDLTNASVGLGLVSDDIGGDLGLRLRVKWMQSLFDRSGQLVAGIDITPLPKLNIAFGVPWTYGAADSVYVTGNADPESRLLAAMLTLSVDIDLSETK